jgi:hypothetical protein
MNTEYAELLKTLLSIGPYRFKMLGLNIVPGTTLGLSITLQPEEYEFIGGKRLTSPDITKPIKLGKFKGDMIDTDVLSYNFNSAIVNLVWLVATVIEKNKKATITFYCDVYDKYISYKDMDSNDVYHFTINSDGDFTDMEDSNAYEELLTILE